MSDITKHTQTSARVVLVIATVLILVAMIAIIYWSVRDNRVPETHPYQNVWSQPYTSPPPDSLVDTEQQRSLRNRDVALHLWKRSKTVLDDHNITLIPCYGTLIGAVRHGGFIPWDDDMDVCISRSDMNRLLALQNALLQKEGIRISSTRTFYKLHFADRYWPFIDVFIFDVDQENQTLSLDYDNGTFIQFDYADWFPLRDITFESTMHVSIPRRSDVILDRLYPSWATSCVSSGYNHRQEKAVKNVHSIPCDRLRISPETILANAWIINTDDSPQRLAITTERLHQVGIFPQRWRAIQAKNNPAFDTFYKSVNHGKMKRSQVACYLSHKLLWRKLLDDQVEGALIFEDDIVLGDDVTRDTIKQAIQENGGVFDILLLGHCDLMHISRDPTPPEFVTVPGSANCAHAYIISRSGLEKFARLEDFTHAIDNEIEKTCRTTHGVFCYVAKDASRFSSANTFGCGLIKQDTDHSTTNNVV